MLKDLDSVNPVQAVISSAAWRRTWCHSGWAEDTVDGADGLADKGMSAVEENNIIVLYRSNV